MSRFRLGDRTPDGKFVFKSMKQKALEKYKFDVKTSVNKSLASEHLTADGHRRSELYDGTPLGDLFSRGTNANEGVNPVIAITEASERYMWEHLVPWVFEHLENGNLMLRYHSEGEVYVHKLPLSAILPYCNGNDISRMLEKGLVHAGPISSRPPKHFGTSLMMASNFLTVMQMYYTGAQAFGAMEMWLAPFIRADNLDFDEVVNFWQMFYHTMNLPFRASGGTPFTNNTVLVWSGVTIRDRLAIVGGEKVGKLGDFMDEAWMNFKAIFKVEMMGGAKGEPFTYPIQNVMYSEELDKKLLEDAEAFEYFFRATGEKGAPYIENATRSCGGKRCLDPDQTQAMCYHKDDKVLIMDKNGRTSWVRFEELFEKYAGKEVNEGWFEPKEEFYVLAYNAITGKVDWRKVKLIRRQKPRGGKIVELKTEDGRVIRVDMDHQLLFFENGEFRLEKVGKILERANDIVLPVVEKSGHIVEEGDPKLVKLVLRIKETYGVNIDDYDFWYLIGYAFADGHLNTRKYVLLESSNKKAHLLKRILVWLEKSGIRYSISYGPKTEEVILDALNHVKSVAGLTHLSTFSPLPHAKVIETDGDEFVITEKVKEAKGTAYKIVSSNIHIRILQPFVRILRDELKIEKITKKAEFRIPEIVFKLPPIYKLAFIEGFIHGDGYMRHDRSMIEIHLSMKSKEFAEGLKKLIEDLGLNATLSIYENGSLTVYVNRKNFLAKTSEILGKYVKKVRVKEVTIADYEDYVYDVEIDGPKEWKNYVVNDWIINHDCCRLLSDKNASDHKKRLLNLLDELPKWIRSKLEPLIEEGSEDYELEARGAFSIADQTGSKGIVSVNLPLLAYKARGDFEKFIDLLIERMAEIKRFLLAWHKWYVWLRWHKYPNVFAFPNYYQTLEEFERDYYLTFGAVGMPEMATILSGERDLYVSDDFTAQLKATEQYIKPVIATMSALAGIWSDPHGKRHGFPVNFNVEEVPAETAYSKMFLRNKKKYGDDLMKLLPEEAIKSFGYANTIYPYYGHAPIMVKAKAEGMVQKHFTGGVMHHFWMGETLGPEVTRKVIWAILKQQVINFSISPLICVEQDGKKRCFTRIVGWMVPIDQFNDYRRKEFELRGFHTSNGLERYKYDPSSGKVERKEKITNVDPFKGIA